MSPKECSTRCLQLQSTNRCRRAIQQQNTQSQQNFPISSTASESASTMNLSPLPPMKTLRRNPQNQNHNENRRPRNHKKRQGKAELRKTSGKRTHRKTRSRPITMTISWRSSAPLPLLPGLLDQIGRPPHHRRRANFKTSATSAS